MILRLSVAILFLLLIGCETDRVNRRIGSVLFIKLHCTGEEVEVVSKDKISLETQLENRGKVSSFTLEGNIFSVVHPSSSQGDQGKITIKNGRKGNEKTEMINMKELWESGSYYNKENSMLILFIRDDSIKE